MQYYKTGSLCVSCASPSQRTVVIVVGSMLGLGLLGGIGYKVYSDRKKKKKLAEAAKEAEARAEGAFALRSAS